MGKLEVKIYTPKRRDGNFYVYLYDNDEQKLVKNFTKESIFIPTSKTVNQRLKTWQKQYRENLIPTGGLK